MKKAVASSQLELSLKRRPSHDRVLPELESEARALARKLKLNCDLEVYEAAGRDPLAPLFCSGNRQAPFAFFGRDPGRDEVKLWKPLVGSAGKRVRQATAEAFEKKPQSHPELVELTEQLAFFSNTVPYKQVGNKAWGEKITLEFRPLIASLLVDYWQGKHIIALGTEAFHWFGLGTPEIETQLDKHWADPKRYERSVELTLQSERTGASKKIHLHPLPHPSPLNVAWFKKFPALLEARLAEIVGH